MIKIDKTTNYEHKSARWVGAKPRLSVEMSAESIAQCKVARIEKRQEILSKVWEAADIARYFDDDQLERAVWIEAWHILQKEWLKQKPPAENKKISDRRVWKH